MKWRICWLESPPRFNNWINSRFIQGMSCNTLCIWASSFMEGEAKKDLNLATINVEIPVQTWKTMLCGLQSRLNGSYLQFEEISWTYLYQRNVFYQYDKEPTGTNQQLQLHSFVNGNLDDKYLPIWTNLCCPKLAHNPEGGYLTKFRIRKCRPRAKSPTHIFTQFPENVYPKL